MSKEVVWASNAMINPAMLRPITHSFADGSEDGKEKYTKAYYATGSGKSLPSSYFPPEIFVRKDARTNYEKLPELFFAGSYWVVSGEVADVMRQFDLGGSNLHPTKVFRKDRKTPIGDAWYCLNFGNVKQVFRGEESLDVYPFASGLTGTWGPPTILKDNQLAVGRDALAGADIWVDSNINNMFFVSDALAKSLKEAGVAKAFGLKKCRMV